MATSLHHLADHASPALRDRYRARPDLDALAGPVREQGRVSINMRPVNLREAPRFNASNLSKRAGPPEDELDAAAEARIPDGSLQPHALRQRGAPVRVESAGGSCA